MIAFFLVAHLAADFILQPYWLVQRKRGWNGLLIHGGIVLACMLALAFIAPRWLALWPAMLAITGIHVATDWWKVHHGDALFPHPIYGFLLDQCIHIATIIGVLYVALPAFRLWNVHTLPCGYIIWSAAGYIVAAFATPIAVMVWLDPVARYGALAGWARMRSFVVGAVVLSLVLSASTLALPATLVGMVIATQWPQSKHPLDKPLGTLVVIGVSALTGVSLLLL
ncbi:MAG TPA: DUF3307 domain-containing protein [Roseiflexaceae bacterium]|jgi:hypothetical protein|nr:DUF3307 domain-containing protein [Roseiflexaceae bacterium]